MKLYSRLLELLLISTLLFVASGCPKNDSGKAMPLALPSDVGVLYDELGFEYAGLKEAEEELLALRDSDGMLPGQKLTALLTNDPATFDYDFPALRDSTDFYLSTSADGNIRFFGWKTGEEDGMTRWNNLIQFRTAKGPYVYHGSIMDFSGIHHAKSLHVGPLGNVPAVNMPDGTPAYLLLAHWLETPDMECGMIIPVKIGDDELIPLELFSPDSTATDGRNVTWRQFSMERREERTGLKSTYGLYGFDRNAKTLYIPEIDGVDATDRFRLYTFENGRFVYVGDDGGYWLHPSIRTFKRLEVMFATPQFMVRIDLMPDDSYRYASWSDETNMIGQPDIILFNGQYDPATNTYTFTNGSFDYCIHPWADSDELTVFQSGEKILSETRIRK